MVLSAYLSSALACDRASVLSSCSKALRRVPSGETWPPPRRSRCSPIDNARHRSPHATPLVSEGFLNVLWPFRLFLSFPRGRVLCADIEMELSAISRPNIYKIKILIKIKKLNENYCNLRVHSITSSFLDNPMTQWVLL